MKVFKTIAKLIVISLILTSCGSDLDCNSEVAKQTVKDILIDLESSNQNKPIYTLRRMSESDISIIINDYTVIKNVRTTDINKELKSCECRATLSFVLDEDLMREMKSDKLKMQAQIWSTGLLDIDGTEIYYNLQETADGELMAETYEIEGLDFIISVVDNRLKVKNNNSKKEYKKGVVLNFASKVNNGENKYKLTFLEDNKIEIEYSYFDFKDSEIAMFENGIINVNGDDSKYVLEKDIFKAFNPESQEYDLHYKK